MTSYSKKAELCILMQAIRSSAEAQPEESSESYNTVQIKRYTNLIRR